MVPPTPAAKESVVIASELAHGTETILLDEPTSARIPPLRKGPRCPQEESPPPDPDHPSLLGHCKADCVIHLNGDGSVCMAQ
ncbi:MAG: hypothetical protein ACKVLM_11405 [Pseudomonadales bacterium]